MFGEIKEVIINSRNKIFYKINNAMLLIYCNVGNIKVEYGKQVMKKLSKELRKFQI